MFRRLFVSQPSKMRTRSSMGREVAAIARAFAYKGKGEIYGHVQTWGDVDVDAY
jgi:hypothetical protein